MHTATATHTSSSKQPPPTTTPKNRAPPTTNTPALEEPALTVLLVVAASVHAPSWYKTRPWFRVPTYAMLSSLERAIEKPPAVRYMSDSKRSQDRKERTAKNMRHENGKYYTYLLLENSTALRSVAPWWIATNPRHRACVQPHRRDWV